MSVPAISTAAPRRLEDLPSPRGLPLLGNLHQVRLQQLHHALERWAVELGTPYTVRLGRRRFSVWSDPEVFQAVLRDRPHGYRRYSPIESVWAEMGAGGVFSSEGAAWLPQRRLVMQALAAPHFRGFFPILQAITRRLLRRWQAAAARGETVEMAQELMRYTVDVTSALAFGEDPNTLEQDGDIIQQQLARIFPMVMHRINFPFPYWRYVKLPHDHRLDRSLAIVHRYVQDMIARGRQRLRDDPAEMPRNLLEAMLLQRDLPGSELTDHDVASNVLTLLLAGEDTTANSVAWTVPFLAADPDLQQRLHDEAVALFGAEPLCTSYEQVKALDHFEALATESGRLRPVVPLTAYEPLQDVELGGVALPAGSQMFFLQRPPMLDPRHYAEPQRYDPQRWLRDRSQQQGAHEPRAYVQFGAGARVCPGRHLAGVEMRLLLSTLMRNFRVELATDPARIDEVLAFTMTPSTMPVRLTALH